MRRYRCVASPVYLSDLPAGPTGLPYEDIDDRAVRVPRESVLSECRRASWHVGSTLACRTRRPPVRVGRDDRAGRVMDEVSVAAIGARETGGCLVPTPPIRSSGSGQAGRRLGLEVFSTAARTSSGRQRCPFEGRREFELWIDDSAAEMAGPAGRTKSPSSPGTTVCPKAPKSWAATCRRADRRPSGAVRGRPAHRPYAATNRGRGRTSRRHGSSQRPYTHAKAVARHPDQTAATNVDLDPRKRKRWPSPSTGSLRPSWAQRGSSTCAIRSYAERYDSIIG